MSCSDWWPWLADWSWDWLMEVCRILVMTVIGIAIGAIALRLVYEAYHCSSASGQPPDKGSGMGAG